jgi:hypothetical protein
VPTVERKLIAELVALYTLEPSTRDVVVEGPSDVGLVTWVLRRGGTVSVSVRAIEDVVVDAETTERHGAAANNRGRVIALAREVRAQYAGCGRQLTCVVDADLASLVPAHKVTHPLVLVTDYADLEMYACRSEPLQKFLDVRAGGAGLRASEVLATLEPILQRLFLIRVARFYLCPGASWINPEACCALADGGVQFNEADWTTRLLNTIGRPGRSADFTSVVNSIEIRTGALGRHGIHGKDYTKLLSWLVRRRTGVSLKPEEVRTYLYAAMEWSELAGEPMFGALMERTTSTARRHGALGTSTLG